MIKHRFENYMPKPMQQHYVPKQMQQNYMPKQVQHQLPRSQTHWSKQTHGKDGELHASRPPFRQLNPNYLTQGP